MSIPSSTDEKERGEAACLVDIRDVQVDAELAQFERIVEYVRQIKNPYRYICEGYIINEKYANNGVTFEDCITRLAGVEIQPRVGELQHAPARHASGIVL